jgi:PAS domain S-box-containing protein
MTGERILVVEDEHIFAQYLQRLLPKLGYQVAGAVPSGEAAVALAEHEQLDLVLMDIELAGEMNGAEAAQQIQALQDVPVVYLTAYTEEHVGRTIKELDPYGYLLKPVSEPMLKITVQMAIERHRLNKKLKESEDALRRERDLLGRIMDTAPVGIALFDRQGTNTFANSFIQQEMGLSPELYNQGQYNDVDWNITDYAGQPLPDAQLPFRQVMETGQPVFNLQLAVQPPKKERMLLSVNAAPVCDETGACDGVVVTMMDVTQTVQAEAELQASETRYRQLVELSPYAIGIHCEGRIAFLNAAGVKLLGAQTAEQLIGKPITEVVHPDYLDVVRERVQASLAKNEPVPLMEEKFIRLDGSIVDVEVATMPSSYRGKPAVQVFVRDITTRKQTESAIRAILNGTAVVGEAFFLSLVSELANALGVRYALVSRILPQHGERVRTVALYADGKVAENIEYDLPGSPCETVVGKPLCFYPRDVQQHFPEDELLVQLQVQSYLGVPLFSVKGEPLGLIAVMDDRPMIETDLPKTLLTIFAARAAAELERLQAERSYQNIVENVSEGVFQSTPDGYFLMANPTMARLLGYDDPEDLMRSVTDIPHQVYVNPPDRLAWQSNLARGTTINGYEAQVYRKDGNAIWVAMSIRGVYDQDGTLLYYEGTLQDVTERKRNEVTIRHLFKQTERRLKYVQALRDIDQAITSSLDLGMTLNLVVEQVVAQLQVDAAAILLINPYAQVLTYASGHGLRTNAIQRTRLRLGESFAGRAAYTRELVAVPDLRLETQSRSLQAFLAGEDFAAYYGAPLIARGQVKGVLEIFHRSVLAPDEEWVNFLETLARQAAIAIDNASLFDALQRSNSDLIIAYDATIEGWSRALDLRDQETEGHTQRVADMTERLAGLETKPSWYLRRDALLRYRQDGHP